MLAIAVRITGLLKAKNYGLTAIGGSSELVIILQLVAVVASTGANIQSPLN
jgi:hypothetical protein